ncbi:unnamed protein product [Blepharisma stoltei]|uniref:3-hydroxyisobutyryl-CoA hydrolase n=1 Tax=Blepharisma stoltei TaxID=1481888 RepID=A0AAU9KBM9_9CILI|nr:unnamed protein product [Blepharisma stoltei]
MENPNNFPVLSRTHNNILLITLNRASALNSLNLEMLGILSQITQEAEKSNSPIIFIGEGRAFCAGGDIVSIAKGDTSPEEFFGSEFTYFHYLSRLHTERIAIMDGIVMGGGVGLSMACSKRIATPKTLWAMPETAIGFTPDVGSTYFLNRINPPELGLYLALTGDRLSGVDCFLFGIADYYIENSIETVKNQLIQEDFATVLARHHTDPNPSNSKIMQNIQNIRYCFETHGNLEGILGKLNNLNNQWSTQVLEKLQEMCPLSLRIAYESFNRGRHMNYAECLIMEYNLVIQLTKHRNYNFKEAVTHKFINKAKGKPNWNPSSISEVGDSLTLSYFLNTEGPRLSLPRL